MKYKITFGNGDKKVVEADTVWFEQGTVAFYDEGESPKYVLVYAIPATVFKEIERGDGPEPPPLVKKGTAG